MNKILKVTIIVIGMLIIVDAIGSIIVYQTQPIFPDQAIRVFRAFLGLILIIIGRRY